MMSSPVLPTRTSTSGAGDFGGEAFGCGDQSLLNGEVGIKEVLKVARTTGLVNILSKLAPVALPNECFFLLGLRDVYFVRWKGGVYSETPDLSCFLGSENTWEMLCIIFIPKNYFLRYQNQVFWWLRFWGGPRLFLLSFVFSMFSHPSFPLSQNGPYREEGTFGSFPSSDVGGEGVAFVVEFFQETFPIEVVLWSGEKLRKNLVDEEKRKLFKVGLILPKDFKQMGEPPMVQHQFRDFWKRSPPRRLARVHRRRWNLRLLGSKKTWFRRKDVHEERLTSLYVFNFYLF